MIEEGCVFKNGTAGAAAAPVVMFPPQKKLTPVVTGLRCTGDASGSLIKIYAGGLVANVKVSASAQLVLGVTSTTGFTGGDVVMIVTPAGACYWRTVTSVQAGVSLTLTANVGILTTTSDRVYRMDVVASLPCGAATVNNVGGINGIAYGRKSMPIACAVNGTSANTITRFSAAFVL